MSNGGNSLLNALGGSSTKSGGGAALLSALGTSSKPKGSSGVGGFVDHLATDVRNAAVGLPAGLVHLAEHPVGSVEAMGKSTWQDWSPLFHGQFGKFAHQFYAHPLAPLLDVASVLSGGLGIASKFGRIGLASGAIDESTALGRLAKFSESSQVPYSAKDAAGRELPTLYKHTSEKPLPKAAQLSIHKLVNQVSPHLPGWFGDTLSMEGRYHRLDVKMMAPRSAALQTQITTFVRAGKELSGPNAATYRRAVLSHSYNQLLRFAREWDTAKGQQLPTGWTYVKKIPPVSKGGRNVFFQLKHPDIETDMHQFAKDYTTPLKAGAATHAVSGKTLIVPKHWADRYGQEGAIASKTLKLLYSKPVQIWKYLLLGTRPAYFVHNAVGNFFMYAMGHGGTAGVKGLSDAFSQVLGEHQAIRAMGKAAHSLNPSYMEKNFRDQLNNTFSNTQRSGLGKLYKYSMFPITHAVTDQFLRRAAINAELRRAPEVAALMKKGASLDKAANTVLDGAKGQVVRDRISQKVMDTMGDYHSMNSGERLAASVMPFYTWNRHALRFTKAAFRDHPASMDVLSKVGTQGTQETLKALGHIPKFMLGSIPLSMLGVHDHGDRKGILATQSLNPLSTAPDMLDFARSLVSNGDFKPGETIGSQLNPVLTGLIQHITGTDVISGAKAKKQPGGLVGDVGLSTLESLPQVGLLQKLIGGNPQPKPNKSTGKTTPFLFSKNKSQDIWSILGLPVKHESPAAAQKQYDTEKGIKKGRRNKYSALSSALNS